MLLVSYDITNNKVRTRLSKFLEKYGKRLQMSVFEIRNSKRILNLVVQEIQQAFARQLKDTDSIVIFQFNEIDKRNILRFGFNDSQNGEVVVFN